MNAEPISLDIYRTAIPMRGFAHAAASRDLAEAVVVRLTFSDGRVGWGETLPRPYVTGETLESVVRDLTGVVWAAGRVRSLDLDPTFQDESHPARCLNAAVCAFDLANLRRICNGAGQIDPALVQPLAAEAAAHRRITARVSGVLGSADPDRTARRLRMMRWFGLRDFKLKLGLGDEVDRANLTAVHRQIGKGVRAGKYTLRVDANGGWPADQVPQRVADLAPYGVCVVEQPVYCPAAELVDLARRCELPLMADESLLTADDANTLLQEPSRVWWNIRLSKNGGLVRALSLACLAARNHVPFTVGCMVGESGILSAAQRRLLELSPPPRFVEGNYGRFLLSDDLTETSPRFGYGGRLARLKGEALGIAVDTDKLDRYGRLVVRVGR